MKNSRNSGNASFFSRNVPPSVHTMPISVNTNDMRAVNSSAPRVAISSCSPPHATTSSPHQFGCRLDRRQTPRAAATR